jgi:hypothetical protein
VLTLSLLKPDKVVEKKVTHITDGKSVKFISRPVEHYLFKRPGFGENTKWLILAHKYTPR